MLHYPFFQKNKWLLIGLIVSIIIKLASLSSHFIENYYVPYLFTPISVMQRWLMGWVNISIGDILYFCLILWILYYIFLFIKSIVLKKVTKELVKTACKKCITMLIWMYAIFNILWGLNYNRTGIAAQLKLTVTTYTKFDVQKILEQIVVRLNETAPFIIEDNKFDLSYAKVDALKAYDSITQKINFIHYTKPSIKKTIFGRIENYLGFQGYYNPFTGEAQVNNTIPKFLIPFVTAHEMAHQLGYAKEDEANFVGFLAAKNSSSNYCKYAAYMDMLNYTVAELNNRDTNMVKNLTANLPLKVKTHFKEWRRFTREHQSLFGDATSWTYNQYLKANDMPQGLDTYNEVVALLIAYGKKYGWENL
jgi:hypothetical protein